MRDVLASPLRLRVGVLVLITIALVMLSTWRLGSTGIDDRRKDAEASLADQTALVAAQIEWRLAATRATMDLIQQLIANAPGHQWDIERICALAQSYDQNRPFQRLDVFRPERGTYCESAPLSEQQEANVRSLPYFPDVLIEGRTRLAGPYASETSGAPTIVYTRPLLIDARIAGVMVATIDTSSLLQLPFPTTASRLLVSTDPTEGVFERSGVRQELLGEVPSLLANYLERARHANSRAVLDDGTFLWSSAGIEDSGLIALGLPRDTAYQQATRARDELNRIMLASAALGLASLLVADTVFVHRARRIFALTGKSALVSLIITRDEIDVIEDWAQGVGDEIATLRRALIDTADYRSTAESDLLRAIVGAVEARYPFLRNHGDRVGFYAQAIACRLGMDDDDVRLVEFAGRVHDVGKIVIPDAVYLKAASLEPIEWAQMQQHAVRGHELVERLTQITPQVGFAVRHHHERWDGSGYPDRLAGEAIPLWARIIAVADAYDAMTEARPYRDPLGHDEAIRRLEEGAGAQWDAAIVETFLALLNEGVITPKHEAESRQSDG